MTDWTRLIRDIPDFPKPGIVFKDIMPMLADAQAFAAAISALAAPLNVSGNGGAMTYKDAANFLALGAHTVRCVGMGGRQVISEPERGQSYDHFAVDYEFPNEVHVMSMCRQIEGTESNVSETIVGSKGQFRSGGYRFTGPNKARVRARGINPYVQEHVDLLESITSGRPLNELQQVAESTLVAIMGRMSAYTGKAVTWDQALNSKLDTFPKSLDMKSSMEEPPIPKPGVTELI